MPHRHFEICIIGQGLAGTTLAWTMWLRGKQVLLIDRAEPMTASRIAAGLLTPLTGPRLAMTLYWEQCRTRAEEFYQRIEQQIGVRFFQTQPAAHLLRDAEELVRFERRRQTRDFQQLTRNIEPAHWNPHWQAPAGGFEMPTAGRLNVVHYLDCSREFFRRQESYLQLDFDPTTDLQPAVDHIQLPLISVSAGQVYFCQGFVSEGNPWFDRIRFQPAKGEILSLRIPDLREHRSTHSGCWLAPVQEDEYLLGSTFEWKQLDSIPTMAAREQLLDRLKIWLRCPVAVTGQQAAVRPTMSDFRPVIGQHPEEPRIGIMNGLGTKGALMAPWLAELLADQLDDSLPVPVDLDVQRWFR